jgi:hypothetical protein
MPNGDARQQEYMVLAPTGVALYSFADLRAAAEEAAELNAGHSAAADLDPAMTLRESAALGTPA